MKAHKSSLLFVVVLKLWIVDCLAVKFAPVVETTKGPVRGAISETSKKSLRYYSYRNIRYAKAPVGYLRFKPPVEVDPWTEVLDAVEDGPVCPQIENDTMIGQEDCLNLNVYTQEIPEKNGTDHLKPVMFWIHGGAFISGYNAKSMYSPDYLIEEGIVFVCINYRLGPLGFLALSHPNATGNAALKDQNLALQWVRDNIAKFGGDPTRVTIFGQSAGGASVDFHMISEKSKGLFHRAITMSGSSVAIWALHTPKVARMKAFQLARKLGSKAVTIDSLLQFYYNVETKSLIEMTEKITIADVPFKATIEDSSLSSKEDLFLTECPIKVYESGNFAQVPHMLGYVKDEALSVLGKIGDTFDPKDYFGEYLDMFNLSDSLFKFLDPTTKMTPNITNISIFTDLLFIAPMDYAQRLISKSKSPVYFYRYIYDYDRSLHKILDDIPVNGTAHSDEIPMIFYSDSFQIDPNENNTRELVQRRMTRLWTNFAKFGNPTPKGGTKDTLLNIVWPDSRPNGRMLEISDKLEARDRYLTTQIKTIETAIGTLGRKHNGCANDLPKIFGIL